MKKKFTHLISCCFALLLLGSGTVWGQTWTQWAGSVCHYMTFQAPSCSIIVMDGTASTTFYRWTLNPSGTTRTWESGTSNCSGFTTLWERRLFYDDSSNPATWYYQTRSRSRSCNYDGYNYNWSGYGLWSNWSSRVYVSFPNTSSTDYYEERAWYSGAWHYGHPPHDHTTNPYNNLIFNLPSVVTSVNFHSPNWRHNLVDYTISWVGDGVPSYTTSETSISGNLPYGTMNSNGSELRFTGSADQITAAGTTLTTATLNLPNKIWFDRLWNGNYNGVTIGDWNPVTQGVQNGQTLGFWHGYNGTNITVNNGILLLGEDASCPDQKFSITSSSPVTIDAYNTNGAPALCVTMPTGVTYNPASGDQPTVAGSTLNITNTNGGCNWVDFCSFFNPSFTGSGVLLIDPNVTNFKAGATFTTAQTGNINIFSDKITTTGDFVYTAGATRSSGDLDIRITNPQSPVCPDCGYFNVSNNFTTDVSAPTTTSSKISITDIDASGYVNVGGNLTHTGSPNSNTTYTIDVDNSINVVGETKFDANRDDIKLLSNKSWINFGDKFTYTGGSASSTVASDLSVYAYGNPCTANACGFLGGYVWFGGDVVTENEANGTVLIKSEDHYVRMDNGYSHTGIDGNMLVDGETRVDIYGSTNGAGVGIARDGVGNDTITSGSGHIMIQDKLTYNQTVAAANGSGLTVQALGGICALECDAHVGGSVWVMGDVTTANTGEGYTNIISDKHYVNLAQGLSHVGTGGDLLVKGETRVDILGTHTVGKGVSINRDSTGGNDKIAAHRGHIFVENDIEYTQSAANDMGNLGSFGIIASGDCGEIEDCTTDTIVDGFVWLHGSDLTIVNKDDGNTKIKSDNHYLQIDGTFNYIGEAKRRSYDGVGDTLDNTTLLVYGNTGIDVLGATAISMDSVGQATFLSTDGHIHFANTFNFIQNDMFGDNGTFNGLSVIAQGASYDNPDCHGRPGYGYVWMEQPVTTTSREHGRTEFVSVNHNVIMDQALIHSSKAEGNLDVIAGGVPSGSSGDPYFFDCAIAQNILPWTYNPFSQNNLYCYTHLSGNPMGGSSTEKIASYLEQFNIQTVDFAHEGRGYVHVGGAVEVDLDSIGNATFQSKADIVQFDETFNFNENGEMGDLYVDGHLGVRSIGAVKTNNPTFSSLDAYGAPIAHDDYKAHPGNYNSVDNTYQDSTDAPATPYPGSGHVRYNSAAGFVDFLSTFEHEALQDSSRLDIEGLKRVKFGDDVNITMSTANDTTLGETFIYSDGGFIDFWKNLNYESRDADLRIWAKGGLGLLGPSHIDSASCTPDGHIRFHGDVLIDYTKQTALSPEGRTWIKSYNDDIFIDSVDFTYKNTTGPWNGMFWMQAGQDIFGREKGKNILFTHAGEKSIVWEAQGSIRTQQDLTFDRKDAKAGNVILKAGYDYTSGDPGVTSVYDIDVHGKDNPVSKLNWNLSSIGRTCPPQNYTHRLSYDETGFSRPEGGDIWFQGNTTFDLSQVVKMEAADSAISVLVRAMNSVYVDSNLVYTQNQKDSVVSGEWNDKAGYFHMFAETGNIEAINAPLTSSVNVTIDETNNSSDIRFQAGNNPHTLSLCNHRVPDFFCGDSSQWDGNILFNKPLNVLSKGKGATTLSAERDIETQVDAPFTFTYNNDTIMKPLLLTAGRHIETHKMMTINYPNTTVGTPNVAQITLRAGRLKDDETECADDLCKTIEQGSSLTEEDNPKTLGSGTDPFDPNNGYENNFSKGGSGHGSILLFDSLEFNYNGKGTILMTALNGNIESDPYLHRNTPPNSGSGYDSPNNIHDAQITFNHGGTGVTRLEAIDIKLHDKLAYYAIQHASDSNGQFYMAAFDSILTRNLSYNNVTDTGSVFITTDKLKRDRTTNDVISCDEYIASEGGTGINQGHIVLGYGADGSNENVNDSIVFNFAGNPSLAGANVLIRAGYDGFANNPVTGKVNGNNLFMNHPKDRNKGYGGNITFDYIKADMAQGNHTSGGYMEISTPNGNIWGKDSISYNAWDGDFLIDAGLGSLEDTLRATRWSTFSGPSFNKGNGHEDMLNTSVPFACDPGSEWRTGNIMLKGAGVTFNNGVGNMTFRTREGFIDTYDAFTVSDMQGHLLKYAAMDNRTQGAQNNWGDVSERDFRYVPTTNSGSVFFGADDNIMLNYGNSNFMYNNYGDGNMGYPGNYDVSGTYSSRKLNGLDNNPYYHTSYEGYIDDLRASTFNVNVDGYMFYRNQAYRQNHTRASHLLYRGCVGADCSGITGDCYTTSNGARDLTLDYRNSTSGGFASVASNYIDLFTKFDYQGGTGTGLHSVPGMGTLHGESVSGYGLYMKSQFNGTGSNYPERRRATCEDCGVLSSFPMGGGSSRSIPEMTYIGFHDDARIHTHRQKSLLEAPVVEFFGHAELDTETDKGGRTNITLKADSLIFHDSVIFAGRAIDLKPFTTDATQRANDMRYGVINDKGANRANYSFYGPAIAMEDRGLPVLELGYQRCNEPLHSPNAAPNARSEAGKERTPMVGGDIIVAFKYGYSMPMFNTVVANHARISFISDSLDNMQGGEYVDAFIRTDLLRIRNHVKFYTDPSAPDDRKGKFVMATPAQMDDQMVDPGMYTRHLHMEPGSELSLRGEDSLTVIPTTVVGGYGNIHENVMVKANGILAPGFASLMEGDCQTPYGQGKLTVHNLQMEKDAVLRISISNRNCVDSPDGPIYCTQTDTVVVQDTVYFTDGKVSLVVLPETEMIDPGCYLFMVYGDSMGVSQEYARNFVLEETRYGDYYFGLNFSEPGKVYLCVSTYPLPEIQRWIDLPEVSGVTTTPGVGRSHVISNQHFTFTARFAGDPLKVRALGFYSGEIRDLDLTGKILADGSYQYTIYQVVEPWTVQIGPDLSTVIVSNDDITGQRVWTYRNTLYINAGVDDVVSIYNMTGVLYRKVDISAGTNKFTLERGIYVVTLKDGTVHKIVIK